MDIRPLLADPVAPAHSASREFARQLELARFNRRRLAPGAGGAPPRRVLEDDFALHAQEIAFVEDARAEIAPLAAAAPTEPVAFLAWFASLEEWGPGQYDPLFPWLADYATLDDMRWFIEQETAGEAGFEDLLALTQIKMPTRAKLEMARNYWDELGRGQAKGMHGPMLEALCAHLGVAPCPESTLPEALALGNMMTALAWNRCYAFHAVGALGAIEMTAPARAALVSRGLQRLGVPSRARHYFALHAVLDVKHSRAWNDEVIAPLVADDPRRARWIAEGALLRLMCGKRCFDRYRAEFGLPAGVPHDC